jgi:hypothetical protein
MQTETNRIERNLSDGIEASRPLWYLVRHLPNFQRVTIARFLSRAAAEAHLRFLAQRFPEASYAVVFDRPVVDR